MHRTTLLLASLAALTAPAAAQVVPTGFIVETVIGSGLNAPTDLCWLADGRMLVANRGGAITVLAGTTTASIGSVPSVETGSERALLSLCPDPNFATNGYLYVWYSSTADSFMHLDRFTCNGDRAVATSTNLTLDTSSRRVILSTPDSAFNHNGGSARFGIDGMLYLSIGDDASACAAQLLTTAQGMLLRMDTSQLGTAASTVLPAFSLLDPGNNPLSANNDLSQLVIAHGLRNPVRMDIDPLTGNLYIADVGQNAHEEYSEYVYNSSGLVLRNFGWPWFEGTFTYTTCTGTQPPGLVPPIVNVPQSQGWTSILGGPRYRNLGRPYDFGPAYEGVAFYGDYFSGQIRVLAHNGTSWAPAPAFPGQPNATNWATGLVAYASLRQGPDGALYFAQQNGTYSTSGGTVKRIRLQGPVNQVVLVSGGGQIVPVNEPFPQPVVAQVNTPQGQPLIGVPVNFSVAGSATLSTTNPVLTDALGRASTTVTAGAGGGGITVNFTNPNGPLAPTSASLFARRLTITPAANFVVLSITNSSTGQPPTVPYLLLASAPGVGPWMSSVGPICTDPFHPSTFAVEDSIGLYSFVSLSGTGAIGSPSLSKLYTFSPGQLTGLVLQFQAVGWDPVTGPFRTNCITVNF